MSQLQSQSQYTQMQYPGSSFANDEARPLEGLGFEAPDFSSSAFTARQPAFSAQTLEDPVMLGKENPNYQMPSPYMMIPQVLDPSNPQHA